MIATALSDAIAAGTPYPVQWWCETCDSPNDGNLALGKGRTVAIDTALPGVRFRPDITVLSASRPVAAVEVVTHDVEHTTATYYDEVGLAVIRVWPTWETLAALRSGFLNGPGAPKFTISGAARCTSPAHIDPVVPCGACGQPADVFRLETVRERVDCWRCKKDVPVLELFRIADGTGFSASDPDISGVGAIAAGAGVKLAEAFSQTVSKRYLMHHCPACSAKVGDFYAYGAGGLVLAGEKVRFASRCPDGHWIRMVAVAVEQTRMPFERGERQALWGEGRADAKASDAPVTPGSAVMIGGGGVSVRQAVARMFGGGFYN